MEQSEQENTSDDEEDETMFEHIPDLPLKQILDYLDFEDLKDMRLVSKSFLNWTTRLVKNFHIWKIDPNRDKNLLSDDTFLNADTDLKFRIPNDQENTNDVLENLPPWLEKCSHRIISLENVSCRSANRIISLVSQFCRLSSLEFSCCDYICPNTSGIVSLMFYSQFNLTSLNFSLLHLDFLECIDFDLPNLKEIKLKDCRGSSGLSHLMTKSSRSLEILRNEDFDDLEFAESSFQEEKFYQLKSIAMFNIDKMRVPNFRLLLDKSSERLRSLILRGACLSSFGELSQDFKVLKEIRLELCCGLDGLVNLLTRSMASLQVLQITLFKNINFDFVQSTRSFFPHLSEFMISDDPRRIITGLPEWLEACGSSLRSLHLNKINLSNLSKLPDIVSKSGRCILPSLVKIRAASCQSLQGLGCLLSICSPSVKILIIHRTDISALKESGHRQHFELPALRTLSLYGCKGHQGLSNLLDKCSHSLHTLHLSRSEAAWTSKVNFPELRGLYLDRVEIPCIRDLVTSCRSNLQVLGLRSVYYVSFDDLEPKLPNLKILSIFPKPGNLQLSKLKAWLLDNVELDYDEDAGDRWIELYFSFDHGEKALNSGEFLWSATMNK